MRSEDTYEPEHDREQCLQLAKGKWNKAFRALGDVELLVDNMGGSSLPEAPMEVLPALGPRIQRHMHDRSRNIRLEIIKRNLGILLTAKKEDPAAMERGIALVGEVFPVLLEKIGETEHNLISCPIGWEEIVAKTAALVQLGREAEAVAWMREFGLRFEAATEDANQNWS